ncbi:MAG: 2-oxoacid:ferredoxin oxidoreductase subunit beta [Deltaproteobacteria bacterium]|nr:2-oxoacid:ferredoxin oxidoreductase subunit beta [Deltaproteobacteria bacterium]
MTTAKVARNAPPHPMDSLLRTERIPHIWCPGCGIGTVFNALLAAVKNTGWDPNSIAMVSGIGCTGRMAGYIKLDSFHTTHGRALPFATGLKLAKPGTKIIVVSGDGDLFAIGGNHFIHAARRNMDMTVICVNNLNYGMTGGQQAPSTPLGAKTTTSVNGSPEEPFNFCYLASACGATYVARWTALQVRSLRSSISEALEKRGFSFVEVITPCPSSFGRRNRMGTALEMMKFYQGRSVIRGDIDPKDASMDIDREITVGKFVDIERPTFMDHYEKVNRLNLPQWRAMHPDHQKGR